MASILQYLRVRAASISTAGVSQVEGSRKYLSKYISRPKPIDPLTSNPIDPLGDDIMARFAVSQHNLEKNANLKYVKVVDKIEYEGKGTFSCITLEAKDGEKVNVYEAHIWDNPSSGWQDLSALHLVGDDDGDDAPTVDNFACFAVDQHNLKENIDILEFVKVVDMKECFVDDGMLYYIILLAKVGEKVNVYGAEILKQDCDLKELKEFNLLGEGPFDDSAKSQEQLQDKFRITKSSMYEIGSKYISDMYMSDEIL